MQPYSKSYVKHDIKQKNTIMKLKDLVELNEYKIDTYRVLQYENERICDTVTLIETPKKGSQRVLVYSPMLLANILVFVRDLVSIPNKIL